MPKSFNDFIKSIDDEEIVHNSTKYISKSNFSDDTEKQVYVNLATNKALLEKYHQWLNS